ncbi:DUF4190 domain-containing protein [Agromyces sp. SYSU T0242]|uniref:DUF4190 domain-containing protein n=1 Tax=Agromyces litoreus TaxID=3158561 RepID=UPI00339529EA
MTDPTTPDGAPDQNAQNVPPPPPPPAPAAQPAPPAPPAQPAPASQPAPAYGGAPSYATPPEQKTNILAIVSLVSAFFISLVAIITGHIALSQIKKTGEQGRGLAIAGLVIGYIGLVVGLIVGIVWIAVLGAAFSTGSFETY